MISRIRGVGVAIPGGLPRVLERPPLVPIGFVRVIVNPWADIFVDGKKVGTTPLAKPLELVEGHHKVELKNPHFPTETRDIQVERGNNAPLRVTLKP